MRWFKRLSFVLLMLLLALSLSLWAMISHSTISAWVVTKLVQQLPMMSVQHIKGSLWDGLAVSQVVVKQDGYALVIEDGWIRWHWQALWQTRSLSVAEVSLGRVAVDLPYAKQQHDEADVDWRNIELPDIIVPMTLQLGQLTLHQLSVSLSNSELVELSDLALSLNGEKNRLTLQQLSGSLQTPFSAEVRVSGAVNLVSPQPFQLGIEAELVEADWGEASVSVMMTGDANEAIVHLEATGDSARLGPLQATGDVWLNREQACSPEFKLVSRVAQVSVTDMRLNWSELPSLSAIARVDAYQNSLVMRGQFYPQPEFLFVVDAVNLSHFNSLVPLSGKVQAKGKVVGDWLSPQGELELKAQGLAWQTHRVADLSLKAKGDLQKQSATLQAVGFSDADKDSRVELQWQGSFAQHQLTLSARAWGASMSSRMVGALDDRWQWSGRLEQLRFIQPDAGLWQQTTPARLTAAQSSFRLQTPLCLQQLTSKACLNQASWSQRQGTQLTASLDEFYLSRIKPWLPKTLTLDGKAQATLTFSQLDQNRQGRLVLNLPASQLNYTTLSGKQSFAYNKMSLIAQLTNQQLVSQLSANFKQGVTLEGQSRHIIGQWQDLDLQAKVNVEDVSIAQGLLPDVTGLAGRMTGSFNVSGQVNRPQLTAQLQLNSVRLTPVVTGVEFKLPQLFLDIKPTGTVSIDGQLLAGEGQATLQGWGSVADWSRWSMDLLIQGQNLRIAKTPQADVWLSPNIQLSATPQQVDILGQLIVPKARLRAHSVGNKAIGLSDDVVVVGEETSNTKMQLVPHMRVLLGEDILLTGSGLSSGLTGQLEITRSRLGNLLFQGEVNTKNGQFKAYQQDLTIEQGRILFNGVSDNPGLNVVASRKVLDETVGVTVSGSLAKPRLKVFSRPAMPDTDALSLLVLGKKTRDMTATDAAILAAKLASENDEDPLLQRLGQEAGLDVGLTNVRGEKNAGLSLGKRLTPDLYVRYVVGAFEYGARLITEYRINRLFAVEVQAGQFPGGDIFYRFEGD